jgi:hypothetical protein
MLRFAILTLLVTGCAPYVSPVDGLSPQEAEFCQGLAERCGGERWLRWCASECVPSEARRPCELNSECILCDEPRTDGQTELFALPNELEYLWTLTDEPGEPIHPAVEPAASGTSFIDDLRQEPGEGAVGPWQAYAPFPGRHPNAREGFCEPGPNRYVSDYVVGTNGAMVMRAQRFGAIPNAPACTGGRCAVGPYVSCAEPPTGCQYRDVPDEMGLGTSSQVDRLGGDETYGFGRYRTILKAAGDGAPPVPGVVYAFFTQGNLPCVDGQPNDQTNTSELDVELSSGIGTAGGRAFCKEGEMCIEVSTWVSSEQGLAYGTGGTLRHQVSAFRFSSPAQAAAYRTYGFDWRPDDVRFTYDSEPHDCDEAAGECARPAASLSMCRHLRFIPRRPAPLHFQLWNAWWAGRAEPGTLAEMSVEQVWFESSPEQEAE